MLDRERILARLDALRGYVRELRQIAPSTLEEYERNLEKRRACERLLQIAIECVLDVCALVVAGLRLGLPGEEDDLFARLEEAGLVQESLAQRLRAMKGFRNLLVHEYGRIDDRLAFGVLGRIGDVEEFERVVLDALQRRRG